MVHQFFGVHVNLAFARMLAHKIFAVLTMSELNAYLKMAIFRSSLWPKLQPSKSASACQKQGCAQIEQHRRSVIIIVTCVKKLCI